MGRSITRKLIMGVSALAATAVCLTSTTYAWFARNANAWTDEYTIRLHTEEGLEISVDGVNFTDTITKSMLTRAVALQRYNLIHSDAPKAYKDLTQAEVDTYGNTVLAPVSPDKDWNFYGFNTVDYIPESKDAFVENGYSKPVNLTELKKTASYLKFDLYFKAIPSSNDPKDLYKLCFADEDHKEGLRTSYIEGDPEEKVLDNELRMLPSKDERDDTDPSNPIIKGIYNSGDTITINPANAMRIGVVGSEEDRVYEINEGYGSSAYEGAPEGLNDPNTNPMVTYFNNLHPSSRLYLRDYDTEYVSTIKNFDDLYSLGNFQRNSEGKYNIVTATFYIWLDGYDADYLEGMEAKSIRFFLNFTKVEG